jgi:TonB-dependent receptor
MAGWYDEISGAGDDRRWTQLFTWNTQALIQRARDLAAQGVVVSNPSTIPGDCGDGFCPSSNFTSDKLTQEESKAAYVQLNLDLFWGDRPVNLDFGVRYEETDVASQALVPSIQEIQWITSNYDYVLPNVDFNIEIVEDMLLRASYSKTIARPDYNSIQGGLTIGECRSFGCFASSGDPALKPLESWNFDFSAEWYYGDGSYAAIGYFNKDVENFIGTRFATGTAAELFPGAGFDSLTNPSAGGLAAIARANGAQTDDEIRDYIFTNFPNEPGVDVAGQIISGVADNDPVDYNWSIPSNSQDATIDGWEVAWQHTFGDSGFGFVANATIVDGDISFDNLGGPLFEPQGLPEEAIQQQFALTGLSDSANFVGFYDKDGIEVRLAYNWRDDFLTGIGHDSFGAQPRYIEDYGQWDLNASYSFDNYQVFLEAINITDEYGREHGRSTLDLLNVTQVGARYAIGFRAKF